MKEAIRTVRDGEVKFVDVDFDEPVKYTDENGTVCDKSTKLSESDKDMHL